MVSRRALLTCAAALGACGPNLAKRFNGYVLVANRGSRTLVAVSLVNFKTEKTIVLGAAPLDVIAHGGKHAALVLLPEIGTIVEVTAEALAITRRNRIAGRIICGQLSLHRRQLWVLASEPKELVSLNLITWQPGRAVPLAHAAKSFDLSPNGAIAAVSYPAQKQCAILNLQSGITIATVDLATEPGVVRFRPDGKQLLIGSVTGRTVTIADPVTGKVLVILPMPFGPDRFCFDADKGGQLFVTGKGMDAVSILYPYQTEIGETVLAGREPGAMAVNDTLLFVTNPPTGDTTVISIADRQVVARIASGEEPCAVLLTPDGEYVLILNRKSGDMAVVRLSKLTDRRYKRAPLFTVIAVGEEPVAAAVVAV